GRMTQAEADQKLADATADLDAVIDRSGPPFGGRHRGFDDDDVPGAPAPSSSATPSGGAWTIARTRGRTTPRSGGPPLHTAPGLSPSPIPVVADRPVALGRRPPGDGGGSWRSYLRLTAISDRSQRPRACCPRHTEETTPCSTSRNTAARRPASSARRSPPLPACLASSTPNRRRPPLMGLLPVPRP